MGIEHNPRSQQACLKATASVVARGAVFFGNTDVGDLSLHAPHGWARTPPPARARGGGGGGAPRFLANQHNGHAARCNSRTMLIGNHGRYQHDAIDRVVLEQVEVLELTLGNVVGVGEQHLIPAATKHPPMPAVIRLTDSELILGTMTPMSLVEPVRKARAWLDRT